MDYAQLINQLNKVQLAVRLWCSYNFDRLMFHIARQKSACENLILANDEELPDREHREMWLVKAS